MFTCDIDSIHITPLPDIASATATDLGVGAWLDQVNADIEHALTKAVSIRQLVNARACAIDDLLIALFDKYALNDTTLALFAVGGYGRGELSLHSDVDIMLLAQQPMDKALCDQLNAFIAKLWDVGIEPAVSVRDLADCQHAIDDASIATALLESRFICGNTAVMNTPAQLVDRIWPHQDFYANKVAENEARHIDHNSTVYNLEPDIKNAPGGLRDIHVVGWVTKRYFRVNKLYDLVPLDFLTEREFDELDYAEAFLWRIRHYLHQFSGRDQNKLLFDYQREVAAAMGYQASEADLADNPNAVVEQFMRDYYRCAMQISTLSELLLAHYDETLIEAHLPIDQQPSKVPLSPHFDRIGEQIAMSHARVFAQHPDAILTLFLLMGQHGLKTARTDTLRALKVAARGIDQNYRDHPEHQALFLANLKQPNYLFHRLRAMKRFGVLGNYLPAFAHVIGLMQYDLFHRYTVDAHTLLLIRILHRFTDAAYQDDYPLVSAIYRRIERKEILVLAAIFHDIAKGRGGNHSQLGRDDAIAFCLAHSMSQADANLVGWLTEQHLLMSLTAQKKDITDPEVINTFADAVGNLTHLNHLYVLTVADMNATNPKLWNSWRATLLKQLYTQTRRLLRADIDAPTNRQDMIAHTREQAGRLLNNINHQHMNQDEVARLWDELGDEYFLRELPQDILWHTEAILAHPPIGYASNADSDPLIALREHRELALDAIQVFVYTQDQSNLFAVTMAVFDQLELDVLDARIITATRDFALDSYVLLDRHGTLLTDPERQATLKTRLLSALQTPQAIKLTQRRLPRRLKHFAVPTTVTFEAGAASGQHTLYIQCLDQPGLLARIGQVFLQEQIEVHAARITTLGERAEDIFYISDHHDQPLSDAKLAQLKHVLLDSLPCAQQRAVHSA